MSAEFDEKGDLWVPVRVRSMKNAPIDTTLAPSAYCGPDGDAVRYINLTAYIWAQMEKFSREQDR